MDCDHDHLTPELEAEVVRRALEQGDLAHAAHHVAGILAADPMRGDFLALFNEVYDAAAEPLAVFTLSEHPWFGEAAVHARALYRRGEMDQAWPLLCQSAQVAPSVPYLAWARGWPLPSAEAMEESLQRLLESHDGDVWRLALEAFVRRAASAYPASAKVGWAASIGARRAGDLEAAVQFGEASVAAEATWMGFAMLASAYKASGDWGATEAAWARAVDLDPDNPSVLLDWGDALVDRDAFDEAATKYRQALERDPDNAWAEGSLHVIEFRREPVVARWVALAQWAREHDNEAARQAAEQHAGWWGWLPDPSEATANALRQIEEDDIDEARLHISHLEGPSVQRALQLHPGRFSLEYGAIPDNGPQVPLGEHRWTLWQWADKEAAPALGPPDEEAHTLVLGLARYRYHASGWLDVAQSRVLGLGHDRILPLLSCALHPPPPIEGFPRWTWLWRVQHAVAFLLAGFPGWRDDQPHVQALRSMWAVRNDWCAVAALAAITARASQDPELEEIALSWAFDVLRSPPSEGAWVTASVAWWSVLRLDLEDRFGLHRRAAQWLDDEESEDSP